MSDTSMLQQQVGYHMAIDMDSIVLDAHNINIFTGLLDKVGGIHNLGIVHTHIMPHFIMHVWDRGYIMIQTLQKKVIVDVFLSDSSAVTKMACIKQQVLNYCMPSSYRVVIKPRGATNSSPWTI